MLNIPAVILTVLLLLGVLLERLSFPTPQDAEPFQQRVASAVSAIPLSFGTWRGRDVALPAPARTLLREPVYLAREYLDVGRDLSGSLVVVYCRDTQDLAGHYPPNCYPSSGWKNMGGEKDVPVPIGGEIVPMKRYEFERREAGRVERLVVYDTFLIPGRSPMASMTEVYRAASNHVSRHYGAAQVLVVMEESRGEEEEGVVREALAGLLGPVVEVVRSGLSGGNHAP